MAKFDEYGNLIGKLGDRIYYMFYGRNLSRRYPKKIKDAKTKLQKKSRKRFSIISKFASSAMDAINKKVWSGCTREMTGFNLFIKVNIPFFNKEGNIEDYERIIFSIGKIKLPSNLKVEPIKDTPGFIKISWNYTKEEKNANQNDRLRVFYVTKKNVVIEKETEIRRMEKTAILKLPEKKKQQYHIYVAFVDDEMKIGSKSTYRSVLVA